MNKTDNVSVWTPYEPDDGAPWNLRRVVHLHRRVVFGACWSEIQRDLAEEPEAAVSRVLNGTVRAKGVPDGFEQLAEVIGAAAVDSGSAERLKAWWLYRCLFSPHPLQERLTLMWHNHFATSNLKVNDLRLMKQQNDTLRKHALSPFGVMLRDIVHDPALLEWLDASSNRAGQPNENLARELMELFALGVGNYSEDDVKEAARALTGWTVRQNKFRNLESLHDEGEKTILSRTGNFDGDDLVDILIDEPAVARRLAWRLTNEFFGAGVVNDSALDELAEGLRTHNLDIQWGVGVILRSQLFFSDTNINSRVCDPVTFLIAPLRAIERWRNPPGTLILAEWIERMGQNLFSPPNVGGWAGGKSWLSTRTVVARANYASALVEGRLANPIQPPDLQEVFERHVGSVDRQKQIRALNQVLFGESTEEAIRKIDGAVEESSDINSALRQAVTLLLTQTKAHLH
ncbi:MAG: DUF1800 domain-containing protein [Planctomycetes bacterium]|nr:DUF1800 domain-containing protein [Planctomycetota bacterium]